MTDWEDPGGERRRRRRERRRQEHGITHGAANPPSLWALFAGFIIFCAIASQLVPAGTLGCKSQREKEDEEYRALREHERDMQRAAVRHEVAKQTRGR